MSHFNQVATKQPFRDLSPEEVEKRINAVETVFWHDVRFSEIINGTTHYVCWIPPQGKDIEKYYKVPSIEVIDYRVTAPRMHFLGIPGAGPVVVDRREEFVSAEEISPELKKRLDEERAMMEKQFKYNKQLSEELQREMRFVICNYKTQQYLLCEPHTNNQILWCNKKEYASRFTEDTAKLQLHMLEIGASKDSLKMELVEDDINETGAGLY